MRALLTPPRSDLLLAAAVAVLVVLEVLLNDAVEPKAAAAATELAGALALAWRRTLPLATATVVAASAALYPVLGVPIDEPVVPVLFLVLASYSVAVHARIERALTGLVAITAGIAVGVASQDEGIGNFLLDAQEEIEVVGEAEHGVEAVELTRTLTPDVVLMDIRMPKLDGLDATRRIVAHGPKTTRVLMLTTFDHDEYVYEALKAGASGFMLKTAPPDRLVNAVRVVAAGETLLAPSITRRLIEEHVKRPRLGAQPTRLGELTARELDVLRLLARGLSNAEIAATLVVSDATVKTHVNRIFQKLSLRDRAQAVVLSYESGLVQPGDVS